MTIDTLQSGYDTAAWMRRHIETELLPAIERAELRNVPPTYDAIYDMLRVIAGELPELEPTS